MVTRSNNSKREHVTNCREPSLASPNSVETLFRQGWTLRWSRTKNRRDTYATMEELCDLLGRRLPVSSVGITRVTELLLRWQEAGLSNARINRKLAVLRPLLKHAKTMGHYPADLPEIETLPEGGGRERFLTRDEAEKVFTCLDPQYQPLFTFLLYTGARYGEAVAVRWSDIGSNAVTFRWTTTKTGKTRTVPLSKEHVTNCLEPLRHLPDGPFLHIDYDAFHKAFRKAVEASKIASGRDVVPHTLRHSCASWMAQAGISMRHIQKWLGHSSVVTTERYAKLTQADLTGALDALMGDRVVTNHGTSQRCEVPTRVIPVLPVITKAYTPGECPERQRGRTVNPSQPLDYPTFIDLYPDEPSD